MLEDFQDRYSSPAITEVLAAFLNPQFKDLDPFIPVNERVDVKECLLLRAVGTIAAIAAMAATLFSNYLTCDIQNALIKLAALQYMFLWPCFLMIITSLSCYPMRDSMGLVARSIIKIIITGALS